MEEQVQEVQQDQNKNRSEYSQKVEALSRELMELASAQKDRGAKTGLVIISVNEENGDDGVEQIISVTGMGKSIVEGLCKFATEEKTRGLFRRAANIVTMMHLEELLGGGR